MEIRAATLDDATAMGEAHAEAWRVGFSGLFEPAWLRGAVEERRRRWTRSLPECQVGGSEVLVADAGGDVVGFLHFGPSAGTVEIGEMFALYVRPDHWGSGAAQLLSLEATERLGASGLRPVVLWTLAAAGRARRFYEHNGWSLTGRSAERDFGDGRPREVVEYANDASLGDRSSA